MKRGTMMMTVAAAMLSAGAQAQSAIGWMDVNKDGQVTQEEFVEMRTKAQVRKTGKAPDKKALIKIFKSIDANGDGVLTEEEVEADNTRRTAG
jgi:Ca2+-binding EF-hand superfamily protein